MLKHSLILAVLVSVMILVVGCVTPFSRMNAELGEEFDLNIGQSVKIKGEKLEIEFAEVIEDSRCSKDVTCIWQGRISLTLEITDDGDLYNMTLLQYGLFYGYDTETYQQYKFTFKVEPYPEENMKITDSDYKLVMTVNRD
jgi:hypothetical protein